jgi:hypothetical protein
MNSIVLSPLTSHHEAALANGAVNPQNASLQQLEEHITTRAASSVIHVVKNS